MNTKKALKILLWAVVGITVVFLVSLISNISDDKTSIAMNSWISTNLVWSYILLIACGVIALGFGLYQTFTDKEAAKGGLITFVCAVVIFGISYLLASGKMPVFYGVQKFIDDGTLTLSVAKWADTMLIGTYILFGLTIVATVYSAIANSVK